MGCKYALIPDVPTFKMLLRSHIAAEAHGGHRVVGLPHGRRAKSELGRLDAAVSAVDD